MTVLRIIPTTDGSFESFFQGLMARGEVFSPEVAQAVERIVSDVAERGDEALFSYTRRFDGYELTGANILCDPQEVKEAAELVPPEDQEVLALAAKRIEAFHRHQVQDDWYDASEEGVLLGQRIIPLQRVGLYAPGGLAAYPSTILMGAIPARVAGVEEIVVCSPLREGRLHPLIAAAARICGITKIFKIGGAQAVAAMAYGTSSV
ncbi:MAG: histidinol dehydrogenase, partial [Syntrophales bacterium]|nr:histidinol dehydrogenase [Syntrophales bacterium]